jgi:endonuclease/exonuclease/phosphatase family metal-dependent hydrolase
MASSYHATDGSRPRVRYWLCSRTDLDLRRTPLKSGRPLANRVEIPFGVEDGFFESLATKSFQRGTLNKGGVSVGIFHTHTQADITTSATNARRIQMIELGVAIQQYRQANPTHPVIVIGDLNVIAGSNEYMNTMRAVLGSGAAYGFPFPPIDGPELKDAGKSLACAAEGQACTSCASNELRQYFNPTDTVSKRLDYALYQDSLDGTVRITPTAYERLELEVPSNAPALSQDGYITRAISDHYGVQVDFQITRE